MTLKTEPLWWESAAPEVICADPFPERTEVAIVGSGYVGLSAALELSRTGTKVVVFDREDIGFGASTRNGGQFLPEPKFAPREQLVNRYGDALASRILEDGRAASSSFQEVIDRESIECNLTQPGRFVGAHCPGAFRNLENKIRQYEAQGVEGFELIPRNRLNEIADTDYYYGGVIEPGGGLLQPALYHRGLLRACQRNGVIFCSNTPVNAIEGKPGSFIINTVKGQILCREVIAATNGYTGKLTPWQRRRLVPLQSFIIATEEIDENRIERMFRNFRGMSNTQRVLFYYRASPDHRRVVFGSRASFREMTAAQAAPRMYEFMCKVYPQLRGVALTHSWNGFVAFSFDHLPHMGAHQGVHYAMGCNGSGVAMMSYLGRQIGLKILGKTTRRCAFEEIPFPTRPLYSGNPWFLPAIGGWYQLRDNIDRFFAR